MNKKSQNRIYKISPPVSKETFSCVDAEGSYIVETAVVVPFFTGFLLVILFFFQVLLTQQVLGNALLKTASELALLSYEKEMTDREGLLKARLLLAAKTSLSVNLEVKVTDEYIDIKALCPISLPIGLFDEKQIVVSQRAKCRKWVGRNPKKQGKDTIVYITPTGNVYHTSKECAYLKLTIHSVSGDKIHTYRNAEGAKYYCCKKCMTDKETYPRVYITDYGTYYHGNRSCSSLKRKVLAVSVLQAEGRRCCSKCKGE